MEGDRDIVAVVDDRRDVERNARLEALDLGRSDGSRTAAGGGENVDGFAGAQRRGAPGDRRDARVLENPRLVVLDEKVQDRREADRATSRGKKFKYGICCPAPGTVFPGG